MLRQRYRCSLYWEGKRGRVVELEGRRTYVLRSQPSQPRLPCPSQACLLKEHALFGGTHDVCRHSLSSQNKQNCPKTSPVQSAKEEERGQGVNGGVGAS